MLSKIYAENFLSWKILNFPVTPGIKLLDGWNADDQRSEGSGKSAIPNALCWAIYGKLPKDANIDEVIKDGETSCVVKLEFSNGDSIFRSRKPNELALVKSGVLIKGKDVRETQAIIEEYIGCNFETFCQSIYFAQNYDKKFLSSNQEDRGKILSSIQNLQVFDKARKETLDLLKLEEAKATSLKNELQIEQNNLSNLNTQKALIQSFIAEKVQKHQQQITAITQQRDLIQGHVKATENSVYTLVLEANQIDSIALTKDLQDLEQAHSEYSTIIADLSYKISQVETIKKQVLAKESEGKLLAAKYASLEAKRAGLTTVEATATHIRYSKELESHIKFDMSRSYQDLLERQAKLAEYLRNPDKTCPTCGSELKVIDLSKTEADLKDTQAKIQMTALAAEQAVRAISQQLAQLSQQFIQDTQQLDAELTQTLEQLQSISQYLDQHKIPDVSELTQSLKEAQAVLSQIKVAQQDTQQKLNRQASLQTQQSMLKAQLANYEVQLAQINAQLEAAATPDTSQDYAKVLLMDTQLSEVSMKIAQLEMLRNNVTLHIARLETLKDGFKDIKTYVFNNALRELNQRANQYLAQLFDTEASIKFTTEEQKIECKLVISGHERSLGLLSGGQNRRFNLAVDLALADIVGYRRTSKLDILILDEYFKDLSEISMEKSLDLLKERKCPVVLIEHNSIFKNIIDQTFFVTLENGTSYESEQRS